MQLARLTQQAAGGCRDTDWGVMVQKENSYGHFAEISNNNVESGMNGEQREGLGVGEQQKEQQEQG